MRIGHVTLFTFVILATQLVGGVPACAENYYQFRIDRWVMQDSLNPPADDAVVFVGSSSFLTWESLTRDFSDYEVIQRGFGGSTFVDLNYFVDDIVLSYDPAAIVVFEGSNDILEKSSEEVFGDFRTFVDLVHSGQAQDRDPIPIFFVGITPTPNRWQYWGATSEANALIEAHTLTNDALYYIDAPSVFLESSPAPGQPPAADLFADGLHPSPKGYGIWRELITSALQEASISPKTYTPNPLHPQSGSRILVDFGPDNPEDGHHTSSPDVNGNHWNNWHSMQGERTLGAREEMIVGGESLGNLVTTEGDETGIDVVITGIFTAAGIRDGGLLTPHADLLGEYAIGSATEDYFASWSSEMADGKQLGGFMLTGLNPSLSYDLSFFGTCASNQSQSTEFLVMGGEEPVTLRLQTSGDGIGNDGLYDGNENAVATANGIRSDEFGQIFVDLDGEGNHRTYLGILEIAVGVEPTLFGDFNLDGVLDAIDIDLLTEEILVGGTNLDLTGDQLTTLDDLNAWVRELKHTWFGDANLDLEFNSSDMVQVFVVGKYETGENTSWSEGDWNGDGLFDSSDMVTAFADGGYEKGLRMDAVAVPEPGRWVLLVLGMTALLTVRRR